MAERLRWWVIPGAVVVLLRVLTLESGAGAPTATSPAPDTAVGPVVARDAIGQRSAPRAPSVRDAFVLQLPSDWAGQRVAMRAFRRIGGLPDASPWFTAAPRVRSDATLPIAGMQAGCYDVEIVTGEGTARRELHGNDLAMPGSHELSALR
jgi:hypothetical protein